MEWLKDTCCASSLEGSFGHHWWVVVWAVLLCCWCFLTTSSVRPVVRIAALIAGLSVWQFGFVGVSTSSGNAVDGGEGQAT